MFHVKTEKIKEEIILSDHASHFKNTGFAGGVIYLTKKRLFFKSEDENFQNYTLNIPLADIKKVLNFSFLGLIKNAVLITRKGKFDIFFLNDKLKWLTAIQSVLKEYN